MPDTTFAKLFETPHGQVLYVVDSNEEDEPCIRVRGAYCGGVKPEATLLYDNETDRDAAFHKADQSMAEETGAKLAAVATRFGQPQ